MSTLSHRLWAPCRGLRPDEYEDASAADPQTGRFALADGATETFSAALWARLLVDDFVEDASGALDDWRTRLPKLQDQWYATVWPPVSLLPVQRQWAVEERVKQGAFATFLGVVLTYSGEIPQWEAVAVGDACLFHTRGSTLFSAFPLDQSGKFNNTPPLLGSRMPLERIRKIDPLRIQASGLAGDRLWMMTDALAKWCLSEHEQGGDPWQEIDSLLSHPEPESRFAAWIEELRSSRSLYNDDVTLLLISL
jgi:hypothetical protein